MNFSKEDQNTFLLVAAILVVCIVTIIVIFSLIWNIIAEPIRTSINDIAYFFKVQQLIDYNFEVPEVKVEEQPQSEIQNTQAEAKKYDTPYKAAQVLGSSTQNIQNAPIVQEAVNSKILTGSDLTQIKFNVVIPSLDINAPALHGSDAEFILQKGFFIYPGSDLTGDGKITLLCYRSQFNSDDPRSCWYLNKLQKDDEIIIDNFGSKTNYKIIGINVFDFNTNFLYQNNTQGNYLQIVTNEGTNRLVILARKNN